jgi:hypothetical protein
MKNLKLLGRNIKAENFKVNKHLGHLGRQKLPWLFRSKGIEDQKINKNGFGHLGRQKLETKRVCLTAKII